LLGAKRSSDYPARTRTWIRDPPWSFPGQGRANSVTLFKSQTDSHFGKWHRELAEAVERVRAFVGLVRQRRVEDLPGWLAVAEAASAAEVRGLAGSLRQDEAAVAATLRLPWSNGLVEGHVHRVKLIKRPMFGRAGFDLLRRRVLHSG
jgi:hypothetical protein